MNNRTLYLITYLFNRKEHNDCLPPRRVFATKSRTLHLGATVRAAAATVYLRAEAETTGSWKGEVSSLSLK